MNASRLMSRLAKEPPFRIAFRALYGRIPVSLETRALWDISEKPSYLVGTLYAAQQALAQKEPEISVIEFGVAGGNGLLALQHEAAAVQAATGVKIRVYGFDAGPAGLPEFCGDHRDHPDSWAPGDFPMDVNQLRPKLRPTTELVLGNVKDTVPEFVSKGGYPPIGFISVDVDLYSSATHALHVLGSPDRKTLRRVVVYFDDIVQSLNHMEAGELLAMREFNQQHSGRVIIDQWRGLKVGRPFFEQRYLDCLYIAHDLEAIGKTSLVRDGRPAGLPLAR